MLVYFFMFGLVVFKTFLGFLNPQVTISEMFANQNQKYVFFSIEFGHKTYNASQINSSRVNGV